MLEKIIFTIVFVLTCVSVSFCPAFHIVRFEDKNIRYMYAIISSITGTLASVLSFGVWCYLITNI